MFNNHVKDPPLTLLKQCIQYEQLIHFKGLEIIVEASFFFFDFTNAYMKN